jgi:hypothetical protein
MQDNAIRQRLRELAAEVATEQDHDKFSAPINEFNQLLDEEKRPPDEPGKPEEKRSGF